MAKRCAFCGGTRQVRARWRLGQTFDVCDWCMKLAGAGAQASHVYTVDTDGVESPAPHWRWERPDAPLPGRATEAVEGVLDRAAGQPVRESEEDARRERVRRARLREQAERYGKPPA